MDLCSSFGSDVAITTIKVAIEYDRSASTPVAGVYPGSCTKDPNRGKLDCVKFQL